MSWLIDLLNATDESEAPKSFIYWSGLCAISAVIKNKVWLDKFYYKLYPNIYVLLVAKSGLRKTFPVALAKLMVEEVGNTRVIAGRNSIQSIIQELSRSYADKTGKQHGDASAFLNSGEFSNLVIDDPMALTILTDLYDGHYHSEWANTLKGSGKERLKGINITLLGATNPSHFQDKITQRDIEGGFIARTLVVSETKKGRVNPLTEPPKIQFSIEKLAERLNAISILNGPFAYNDAGKKLYEEWYEDQNKDSDREDRTGIANRIHDHVLKIAMLLSLADSDDLILTEDNIRQAIDACTMFSTNVYRVTAGTGRSRVAPQTAKVIQVLMEQQGYTMTRSRLLQRVYGDIDAIELDLVITTLEEGNILHVTKHGVNVVYTLDPKFMAKYLEHKMKRLA